MKIRVALVLAFSLLTAALRAEKISLVGATVINPGRRQSVAKRDGCYQR